MEGKVALITGGGTGLGAAVARRFSNGGASIVVTGRHGTFTWSWANGAEPKSGYSEISKRDAAARLQATTLGRIYL